ncbi:hypothetical protein GGQ73_004448 [Rhizobium skierniewicense]|uniref:Uncharacterized protein n=1 Tax=Rhizobium skierniewicense TaxID=984260 RepID=A0A7W6CBL8_9HYPH|nr:hypothetical protein [Rhizobium skierniewicense]
MQRRSVEVYDVYSGLGGTFTVEIVEQLNADWVKVRVWYGRATSSAWECWPEWDGFRMEVSRRDLRNKRQMKLFAE